MERRLLQCAVALACLVPVLAGASGAVLGISLFNEGAPVSVSAESHFRYLSGLLLAIGVTFARMIAVIERSTKAVRLLTSIVFIGGLARLYGVVADGVPSAPMVLALGMELVVTPALCLWQGRVARLYYSGSA